MDREHGSALISLKVIELERKGENRMNTKEYVKEVYGKIAEGSGGCGCDCGPSAGVIAKSVGYSDQKLKTIPEGSNLGLGSGNPTATASIKEG